MDPRLSDPDGTKLREMIGFAQVLAYGGSCCRARGITSTTSWSKTVWW